MVTGPPGIILEALKGIHENKPSVTPQWCGPLRMNTAVRCRVPSKVMPTPSNITRTAIRNCQPVSTGGLSPWPRQHDDIRYVTWQRTPEYSVKGDFMSREIWMSC